MSRPIRADFSKTFLMPPSLEGLVEKVLMLVYPMDNTIVRPMAVGAYGGTPGIWAVHLKIRMLF